MMNDDESLLCPLSFPPALLLSHGCMMKLEKETLVKHSNAIYYGHITDFIKYMATRTRRKYIA